MDGFLKVRSSCVLREATKAHQGPEKMREKSSVSEEGSCHQCIETEVPLLSCTGDSTLILQYQNSETKCPSIIPKSLKIFSGKN